MTPPIVSIIVAAARNGLIGCNNRLPWRLPDDLKRFKALTMGRPMIMGRKTFESLPGLLPGRRHIVLSRDATFHAAGCEVVGSPEAALSRAGAPEVFVIGGAEVYRLFLPLASHLYLTRVEAEPEGDAFLPEVPWDEWVKIADEPHPADERHGFAFRFQTWERREHATPMA